VLIFNNGLGRPGGDYSSVEELVLPVDGRGEYAIEANRTYGPREPVWSYTAPRKSDFSAGFLSGAQRLPNGNTLVCDGMSGRLFEVTQPGEMVWNMDVRAEKPASGDLAARTVGNPLFRAQRYGKDYPGLAGKELQPRQ
jgi:hypothetical protein